MQRIGRASHQVGAVSRGHLFPKHRGDLLAMRRRHAAMQQAARSRRRATRATRSTCSRSRSSRSPRRASADVRRAVRARAPRRALRRPRRARPSRACSTCSPGRYPSDEFAELRPRIIWDRMRGTARARARARSGWRSPTPARSPTAACTASSWPDGERRRAGASASSTRRWCSRAAPGDVFLLGASSWRIEEITRDRVLVAPAPGEPGKMPFWHGDRGRPPARARARHRRAHPRAARPADAKPRSKRLSREHDLDARAARNLRAATCDDQAQATGAVPNDRTIVVERFARRDGRLAAVPALAVRRPRARALGDGARRAAARRARRARGRDCSGATTASCCACPSASAARCRGARCPTPTRSRTLVVARARRHQRSSRRASARPRRARCSCPRRRPGQRTPLWMQRKRARDLLAGGRALSRVPDRARGLPRVPAATCSICRRSSSCCARASAREIRAGHRRHPDALAFRRVAALRLRRQLPLRRRRAARRAARPGAGDRPGAAARAARRGGAARAARPAGARRAGAQLQARLEPGRGATTADRPSRSAAAARRSARRTSSSPGSRRRTARRPAKRPALARRGWCASTRAIAVEDRRRGALRRDRGRRPLAGCPRRRCPRVCRRVSGARQNALRELVARYARTHGPVPRDRRGPPARGS